MPPDFAAFLQSPEGVEAIRKAYTPLPVAIDQTLAHNKSIIQDAYRLQNTTYVLPIHLFNTAIDQQLWRDSLIQSHAPNKR
jgi:hypothetical protein